jgi:hypothetical protein
MLCQTPPCFLAVLFRTIHLDPFFLLVLWFSPSVSPCPGLTNRNWFLPSVPYIYTSLPTCEHSACHLLARWFAELLFDPEDGGDTFLQNVGYNSTDYMASYPRRRYSSKEQTFIRDSLNFQWSLTVHL